MGSLYTFVYTFRDIQISCPCPGAGFRSPICISISQSDTFVWWWDNWRIKSSLQVRRPRMLLGSTWPALISSGPGCVIWTVAAAGSVHVSGFHQYQRQGEAHMFLLTHDREGLSSSITHTQCLNNSVKLFYMFSCRLGWYQQFRHWTPAACLLQGSLPSVVSYPSSELPSCCQSPQNNSWKSFHNQAYTDILHRRSASCSCFGLYPRFCHT